MGKRWKKYHEQWGFGLFFLSISQRWSPFPRPGWLIWILCIRTFIIIYTHVYTFEPFWATKKHPYISIWFWLIGIVIGVILPGLLEILIGHTYQSKSCHGMGKTCYFFMAHGSSPVNLCSSGNPPPNPNHDSRVRENRLRSWSNLPSYMKVSVLSWGYLKIYLHKYSLPSGNLT